MAEAVVSSVVTRIGELLVQEGKFLSGVSKQVELLQTELNLIQGLLKDAEAKQDESEAVRRWIAEIRDLAYDADDIIATYALTVGSKKGGGLQKLIAILCACILCEGITVHKVGSKIEDIKARVSSLRTNFREYGIRESVINRGGSSSFNEGKREEMQTFSHLEHVVVGFEDELNQLVEFLLKEGEGNRVASICGMGGLGKTTLAKMVYDHSDVKKHFIGGRTWSYISQQCQRRLVWKEILIKLLSPTKEDRDEIQNFRDAEIVGILRDVLCKKKCLVILDDIWDIGTWNSLCAAFPLKNTSSKILLTSRNKEVSQIARGFLCELRCLNEESSWRLFRRIAIFRGRDCVTNTNEPNIEKLGKEMIEYCAGLPLAITVLGGLLAAKQTLEEWQDVLKHIKSYIFKEDDLRVNKVLSLSYNDLPSHLKPCFLYLGHFPKNFEIPIEELIQMWMGEGFIAQNSHEEDSEDTMEHEGKNYLWELMQRCMVQGGEISEFGTNKTCQIHDLMRDFCISKAQEENFLQITKRNIHSMEGSQGRIGKIRRLAITLESNDNYLIGIQFREYPYLRSLLYFVHPKEFYFKKSKFLRVLNMKNYKGESLPKGIGHFIHLRFLSLENSNINEVPSCLRNLRCLQTLDLQLNHYEVSVPNVFKEMEQLRHLYLPYSYKVSKKLELGNLCYLQTLLNVGPETIKMPTSFRFNHLQILGFKRQLYRPLLGMQTGAGEVPDVIQILLSCPHIYKLIVEDRIMVLPEARQFSPNLVELELCFIPFEEDPMPTLEMLPNLNILRLIGVAFSYMVCSEEGFPSLKYLHLFGLNMKNWMVKEGAMPRLFHLIIHDCDLVHWRMAKRAMPNLCRLEIDSCRMLETIPDELRFIKNLWELEIRNMAKSFKDRLSEGGLDFDRVKHVSSIVFRNCDGPDV